MITAESKKYCSHCDEWKLRTDFYPKIKGDFAGVVSGPCKPCYRAIYNTDYRKSVPSWATKNKNRKRKS